MDSERARVDQAIKQLQSTKYLLEEGCETAKTAVRSNLALQMEALRARESWLLHQVDLHRSERLEALQRHQEALQAAADTHSDRLHQLLTCRMEPPFMTFRAESALLREVISQYGRVNCGYPGHFADDDLPPSRSLPRAVEDYDEDLEHVEHKSVSRDPAWIVRMPAVRPGLPLKLNMQSSAASTVSTQQLCVEPSDVGDGAVANWLLNTQKPPAATTQDTGSSESYELLSSTKTDSESSSTPGFSYFSHVQNTPLSDWLLPSHVSCCHEEQEDCQSMLEIESLSLLPCATPRIPPEFDEAPGEAEFWRMFYPESDPLVMGVCRANELCRNFSECCLENGNCSELLSGNTSKALKESTNQWLLRYNQPAAATEDLFTSFRELRSSGNDQWLLRSQPSVNKNSPAITSKNFNTFPALFDTSNSNLRSWLHTQDEDTPAQEHKEWLNRYVQVLLTELPEHEADVPIDKWLMKRTV